MTTARQINRVTTIGNLLNNIAVLRRESLQLLDQIPGAPAHAQRELIGILMRHPEGISIKDIARIAKITSSAATQRVEALEKLNVVQRQISSRDNRYTAISLSAHGKKEVTKSLKKFANSLDTSCLYVLNDEELQTLHDLLGRVAGMLEPA